MGAEEPRLTYQGGCAPSTVRRVRSHPLMLAGHRQLVMKTITAFNGVG